LKPSKRDTVPLLEAFTFTTWKCFSDFHNCIHMYIYVLNYIYIMCVCLQQGLEFPLRTLLLLLGTFAWTCPSLCH
jgi:hypothetical protein